ncbi:hypothetical protein RvY_16300 [Ramazzottius varieornatus]|uniref:Uncharacterized protein n=1 Tax=Ramazzottius varieornatus TaxID=947166 RepID=A0A1D1W0U3_RAMVA|nr:hypothetical protein RvY_16300 [Ramazzottius varieornatus]
MAESIGRLEIQELRSLSLTMNFPPRAAKSMYRGDRSLLVESLETLLCNIEKRPLAVEIGMLKFVDSRSFAGLLALMVGYLCFLVERNEGFNETSNIRQYASVLIAKINVRFLVFNPKLP